MKKNGEQSIESADRPITPEHAALIKRIENDPAFEGVCRVIKRIRMEIARGERPWPGKQSKASS